MTYISEKILEILKESAEDTAFIIDAMLSSKAESYRKLRGHMAGHMAFEPRERMDCLEEQRENQKLYNTLNHLKREGFIKKEIISAGSRWEITRKGLLKLGLFKKIAVNSVKEINYEKKKSDTPIILAFDIPGRYGRHRRWLRETLKFLDFRMIQRSVLIGNCKIPEQFIKDLEKREILKCVDIFEVGKKGTLERLKFN